MHIKLDGESIVSKRDDGSANIAYLGGTVWVPKSVADGLKDGPAKDVVLPVSLYTSQRHDGKSVTCVRFG